MVKVESQITFKEALGSDISIIGQVVRDSGMWGAPLGWYSCPFIMLAPVAPLLGSLSWHPLAEGIAQSMRRQSYSEIICALDSNFTGYKWKQDYVSVTQLAVRQNVILPIPSNMLVSKFWWLGLWLLEMWQKDVEEVGKLVGLSQSGLVPMPAVFSPCAKTEYKTRDPCPWGWGLYGL